MDSICCFFFFNDTATTEIYTLSLHDALPISGTPAEHMALGAFFSAAEVIPLTFLTVEAWSFLQLGDRKSTRLNSSHANISYAVFCLKKKNDQTIKMHHVHLLINTTLSVNHLP